MLNSYAGSRPCPMRRPAFCRPAKNSGNAVNPPNGDLVQAAPSGFTMNNSNLRPSQLCLFDEKIIFLPSVVKDGANWRQPKFVIWRVSSRRRQIRTVHLHGDVRFSVHRSGIAFFVSGVRDDSRATPAFCRRREDCAAVEPFHFVICFFADRRNSGHKSRSLTPWMCTRSCRFPMTGASAS